MNISELLSVPLHGLSLIPFRDVYKHDGDSDFLVDVMSLLFGVSTEKQYERDGKMTKMVVMELIDYQGKLECTLFGDYVEELNTFLGSGDLNDLVDGMYIVLATINEVVEDVGWWYPPCKCHRAVNPDSGLYYCDTCFCHVLNVTPRYRIKVNVEDDSGCAVFVLFDRDAQQILHKACADLVAEGKSGIDGLHPAVLAGLVGKMFKI